MTIKDILVCIDPTEAGSRRLRLAASLAREHAAHLSAAYVHSRQDEMPARDTTGLALPALEASGTGESIAVAELLQARFHDALQGHSGIGDWHHLSPVESNELVAMIRTVDLAIVGQVSPDYTVPSGFRPSDLVMAAGRPLLITPYAGEFATTGQRVLIAWDGTREAARAVHDALPLIARAELAVVMTVRSDSGSDREAPGLGRIVRSLERHEIRARAEEAPQSDIPVADVLLSRAADIDADLIVAGAYHHSQLREALLGGVSRELLDHMTVPLLMSH